MLAVPNAATESKSQRKSCPINSTGARRCSCAPDDRMLGGCRRGLLSIITRSEVIAWGVRSVRCHLAVTGSPHMPRCCWGGGRRSKVDAQALAELEVPLFGSDLRGGRMQESPCKMHVMRCDRSGRLAVRDRSHFPAVVTAPTAGHTWIFPVTASHAGNE